LQIINDELLHGRVPQDALALEVPHPHLELGPKPLSRAGLERITADSRIWVAALANW
jgi:hypothetical protein